MQEFIQEPMWYKYVLLQCGTNMCSDNGPPCITACIECSGVGSYNTSEGDREVAEDIDIRILFENLFS